MDDLEIYELRSDVSNVIEKANNLVLDSSLLLERQKRTSYYGIQRIRNKIDSFDERLELFDNKLWHPVNVEDIDDLILYYALDEMNEAELIEKKEKHQKICVDCSLLLNEIRLYIEKYTLKKS